MDGLYEGRIAITVLNSIEHKAVKCQLEGERDLEIIVETMRTRFEHSGSIMGPLMKLNRNSHDVFYYTRISRPYGPLKILAPAGALLALLTDRLID